jgi:tetratricopeptide (TPR) repeat protein
MADQHLESWLRRAAGEADPPPVRARGLAGCAAGRWREALPLLREAYRADRGDVEVVLALARAHQALGEHGEALQVLLGAHDRSAIHFAAGEALLAAGRWADAEAAFERVVELRPDHLEALVWLGSLHLDAGDDARALARLEQAIEVAPEAILPRWQLAALCHRRQDHARALGLLSVVLRLDPGFVAGHRLRAYVAEALGDWQLAAHAWGDVLEHGGEDADALYDLARALLALDEPEDARSALAFAEELTPGERHIEALRAEAEARLGHVVEAVRRYRKLVEDPRYEALARAALARLVPFSPRR